MKLFPTPQSHDRLNLEQKVQAAIEFSLALDNRSKDQLQTLLIHLDDLELERLIKIFADEQAALFGALEHYFFQHPERFKAFSKLINKAISQLYRSLEAAQDTNSHVALRQLMKDL